MKRLTAIALSLLATATMLECGSAQAQARGPSAEEVRETGQHVESRNVRPATRVVGGWREIPIGDQPPDVELSALGPSAVLDEASRATKLAELDTWFRHLPGRFRIDGLIQKPGTVKMNLGFALDRTGNSVLEIPKTLQAKVTGIADCESVGEGVGVQCILDATWPNIDEEVASISTEPTDSEMLKTLRPGMLDIGLNLDPPGVRALLVTDDSVAHTWAGRLTENTVRADRLTDCRENPSDNRCLQPFEMIAAPDSGTVTIILRKFVPAPVLSELLPPDSPRALTITITMIRDENARAEAPMLTKKVP